VVDRLISGRYVVASLPYESLLCVSDTKFEEAVLFERMDGRSGCGGGISGSSSTVLYRSAKECAVLERERVNLRPSLLAGSCGLQCH
jgi:hypothetical protein